MGNGGICRHAARGTETSDGGLRVTGVGDVHVGVSLRKESNGERVLHRERDMDMGG